MTTRRGWHQLSVLIHNIRQWLGHFRRIAGYIRHVYHEDINDMDA